MSGGKMERIALAVRKAYGFWRRKKPVSAPPHDAWLMWNFDGPCNLSCEYCFSEKDRKAAGSVPKMPAIDIEAVMKSLERTGKRFKITFVGGGEPFLIPNIIEACERITQKHYVSFNTNLTNPKIKELCRKVEPKMIRFIFASMHIKELEKRRLTERYISNFLLCKKRGINVLAQAVAYPELYPEIDKYRAFFRSRGIEFKFINYSGAFNGKLYPQAYTEAELAAFGIQHSPGLVVRQTPEKLCNAGYNVARVKTNGDVQVCSNIAEPLGNVYTGFEFKKEIIRCGIKNCVCPFYLQDANLFKIAAQESQSCRYVANSLSDKA